MHYQQRGHKLGANPHLRPKRRKRDALLSNDGHYVSDDRMKHLCGTLRATLVTDFGRYEGRRFAGIQLIGGLHYADCITGTIYRSDGSSSAGGRMRIEL